MSKPPTAYAPDGKPWRDMLYEEAGKRAGLLEEIERLLTQVADLAFTASEHAVEIDRLKAERKQMREAIEQALDDMGEKGLSVCQQAKEMLQTALAKEGT